MGNKKDRIQIAKDIARQVEKKNISSHEVTLMDKIDRIVAHKWLGLIIFGLIMWFIYTISQYWLGPIIAEYVDGLIGLFAGWVESMLINIGAGDVISGLILEGIIGGFAAVVGFLPLIMVLFFFLNLLEDSGYMARVALLMDKFFKKVGLAGKSIIPMYVGTACSIPAVMSARTIKNERQRRMTVLLTPFIPCGAKLPVIALFLGVFFTGKAYMTAITYFAAIAVIFLAGYVIKSILNVNFNNVEDTFLIVELPEYKIPSIPRAFSVMLERGKVFIINASTIIVIANTIVWFLLNFNFTLTMVEDPANSMLHALSTPLAFLLIPLGFGVWGLAAAAVTGFVAKEEVVGALALIFAFSVSEEFDVENIQNTRLALQTVGGLTAVSGLSYMVFNLFTPPCFAAIGAMKSELNSRKWTWFAIGLQFAIGYFVALVVYQVGTIIVYGELGQGFIASIFIVIAFIAVFLYMTRLAKQGKGLAKIG